MSDNEFEVLNELEAHCRLESYPARPMDIGGSDGSHHSATLKRLSERGLVERKRRGTLANYLNSRGSYCYRITPEGITALVAEKQRKKGQQP